MGWLDALGCERPFVDPDGPELADRDDYIVELPILGEVLLGVVDDEPGHGQVTAEPDEGRRWITARHKSPERHY